MFSACSLLVSILHLIKITFPDSWELSVLHMIMNDPSELQSYLTEHINKHSWLKQLYFPL